MKKYSNFYIIIFAILIILFFYLNFFVLIFLINIIVNPSYSSSHNYAIFIVPVISILEVIAISIIKGKSKIHKILKTLIIIFGLLVSIGCIILKSCNTYNYFKANVISVNNNSLMVEIDMGSNHDINYYEIKKPKILKVSENDIIYVKYRNSNQNKYEISYAYIRPEICQSLILVNLIMLISIIICSFIIPNYEQVKRKNGKRKDKI